MKTKVIMKSSDRTIFGQVIRQETKLSMLNIQDLERIAAQRNALKGYNIKHVPELLSRKENIDRIYYILKKLDIINVDISTFIDTVNKTGIITTLKNVKAWKTTGARHTKTTWANPYIWSLLALELSPEIYGETVIWLTDQLIINRIEAGNFYRSLTNAVSKFDNVDYMKLAKSLNYIVFNRHEKNIRNSATQNELEEIKELEKKLAFIIDNGFINSFDDLIIFLRMLYNKKYKSLKQ